jgi:hypothetical protein
VPVVRTAPPPLEVKLTLAALEGTEPFYVECERVSTEQMRMQQMKHSQELRQSFYCSWTPLGKEDGKYTVVQKILGVKTDIDIGGNKISFDSTAKDSPKNPMSEFFKALIDQEFTITIGKDKGGKYQVEEVKGVGNLVNKLGNINPQMTQLLKQILTEDTIKQMAEPMLGVIPPNGVIRPGKTWSRTSTQDQGPIGTYKTTNRYASAGRVKDLAKIEVKTDMTYSPPPAAKQGAAPFQILTANVTSKDSGGTVLFNVAKGRVESADTTVRLEGSLTIRLGGMNVDVEIERTRVTRVRVTDRKK